MTSVTANITAADLIARQLIQERIHGAGSRATARNARAERRAARREARRTAPARAHHVPSAAFRFLHPVR